VPEDEDADLGTRIQRLMTITTGSLPKRPAVVPADLNAVEQALLRDVGALPDPTPLMEGEEDMDFGNIELTDFE